MQANCSKWLIAACLCCLAVSTATRANAASDACVAANATFSANNDQSSGSPLSSPIPWSQFEVGEQVTVVFNTNQYTEDDRETVYWDSDNQDNYEESGDGYFGATDNAIILFGETGPVEFRFTVTEEARASGTELTLQSSCGEVTVSCEQAGGDSAGFGLEKSSPVPPLQVGKLSTYTLSAVTTADSVTAEVKDQLPTGMKLVNVGGNGWECNVDASNLVSCQKQISRGSTEQIPVTVTIDETLDGQNVTNYASAGTAGNAPQPGGACVPDAENTTACAEVSSNAVDINDKIKAAVEDDVKAYLAARLDQIMGSFDKRSRLQSFRDTACGVSQNVSMSGEATSNDQNLMASGTFSMKGGIVPTADVASKECGQFNLWSEVDATYVNGLDSSSASGGVLTAGAEYLFTDNFLAGLRLSVDYLDASFDSDANSEISGFGWLAGPYIAAELANNVFLDGFLGYGTSSNDYDGNYEGFDLSGEFGTQRMAGYLNISGKYQSGALLLTPLIGASYGKEWSDSFKVQNGTVGSTSIDSQDAELGRLIGRIEAGYLITDEIDERLEIFVAPEVTYDMLRNAGDEGDMLLGSALWRPGVEGGFRFARDRFGATLLLGYSGIGAADWSALHGKLGVNYTW